MAPNPANVNIPVDGIVWANVSNASACESLAVTPTGDELGLLSEDGFSLSRDRSSDSIRAWQKRQKVRTVVSDPEATFTLKVIENTEAIRELYHGATESGGKIYADAGKAVTAAFVIDWLDNEEGRDTYSRYIIPSGTITDLGELVHSSGEVLGYEITISCNTTTAGGNTYDYVVITGDIEDTGPTGDTGGTGDTGSTGDTGPTGD